MKLEHHSQELYWRIKTKIFMLQEEDFWKIIDSDFGGSEYVSLMEKFLIRSIHIFKFFGEVLTKKMTFILYTRDLIFKYNGQEFDKIFKISDREEGLIPMGQSKQY